MLAVVEHAVNANFVFQQHSGPTSEDGECHRWTSWLTGQDSIDHDVGYWVTLSSAETKVSNFSPRPKV